MYRMAIAIALMFIVCMNSAFAEETDPCDRKVDIMDAYDPAAPLQRREAALAAMRSSTQCAYHAFSLGQLYRHGPDLPGNLVARDLDRARSLILAYAESGYINAYADLAELELKAGNARDAMKWTQVYLSLLKTYSTQYDSSGGSFDRGGYNANLLLRADEAWREQKPKVSRSEIGPDMNTYLAGRRKQLADGIRKIEDANKSPGEGENATFRVKSRANTTCSVQLNKKIRAAYATYLVEVQPSGAISRVVLENFSPEPEAGERLKKCFNVESFYPVDSDEPRIARFPVVYGPRYGVRVSR